MLIRIISNKSECHLTSAAAFVEGGIQEACDDACSICLEAFCDSDPSTVTSCKHEFHLQCILEWCQRSSQCPMCWQPISLKDPTSQELLEAVERERTFRFNPSRNATIFHHPTLGDFELQHLPVGANDAELEERIIQHLAAAAAMGRARHIARRKARELAHPSTPQAGPASSSPPQRGEDEPAPAITAAMPSSLPTAVGEESSRLTTSQLSSQAEEITASASGSIIHTTNQHGTSSNNRVNFEEYKGMEGDCSLNTSMADIGSDVRREVNAGIATVSRMMEHLETRDNSRTTPSSVSDSSEDTSSPSLGDQRMAETSAHNPLGDTNVQASCAASSGTN
ncbi:hypothetical protein AAG906_010498 [Vitis piasezkii]